MLAVFAGLVAAAIVLVLDGLWAGRAMFRGVAEARSALTEGAVAVVTGDPAAARPCFERAAEAADSTVEATAHPSIALAERIPWLGDNIKAVEAVARASERSANAGLTMVDAALLMDWQDVRLPATEALGAVDLPKLRAATPMLEEVAKGLGSRRSAAGRRRHRATGGAHRHRLPRRARDPAPQVPDRQPHP